MCSEGIREDGRLKKKKKEYIVARGEDTERGSGIWLLFFFIIFPTVRRSRLSGMDGGHATAASSLPPSPPLLLLYLPAYSLTTSFLVLGASAKGLVAKVGIECVSREIGRKTKESLADLEL